MCMCVYVGQGSLGYCFSDDTHFRFGDKLSIWSETQQQTLEIYLSLSPNG